MPPESDKHECWCLFVHPNRLLSSDTPQNRTPGPVQSLTPTLQDSLEWKESTASEASSATNLTQPRRISSLASGLPSTSGALQDDVFVEENEPPPVPVESTPVQRGSDVAPFRVSRAGFKIPSGTKMPKRPLTQSDDLGTKSTTHISGHNTTPVNRNQSAAADEDTPHLYRTKEAIQKSYAARHLASMRKGRGSVSNFSLDEADSSELSDTTRASTLPRKRERLRGESAGSIELQRYAHLSPPPALSMSDPKSVLAVSPEDSESFQKKRRFHCVDKSPVTSRENLPNSTGLTMEFEKIQVNSSNPPAKRCNMDQSPVHAMTTTSLSVVPLTPKTPCTPANQMTACTSLERLSCSPVLQRSRHTSSALDELDHVPLEVVFQIPDLNVQKAGGATNEGPVLDADSLTSKKWDVNLDSDLDNLSGVGPPGAAGDQNFADESLSDLANDSDVNDVPMEDTEVWETLLENIGDDANAHAMKTCFSVQDSLGEENAARRSPATSTPRANNSTTTAGDSPGEDSPVPGKKAVNKFLKKVRFLISDATLLHRLAFDCTLTTYEGCSVGTVMLQVAHFSSMPSSVSSGCHSSESEHSRVGSLTPCPATVRQVESFAPRLRKSA